MAAFDSGRLPKALRATFGPCPPAGRFQVLPAFRLRLNAPFNLEGLEFALSAVTDNESELRARLPKSSCEC